MRRSILPALLCAAALAAPAVAAAQAVRADHIQAELIAERVALVPGDDNWLALRLKPDAGWHTYWRNPGDSGIPTSLRWQLPAGFAAGDILWPYPERHPLGEVMNYGYGGETLHLVQISVPTNRASTAPVELKAEAKWLVCSDICIPGKADLTLALPVAAVAADDARWRRMFAQARARLPEAVGWPAQFETDPKDFSLAVTSPQISGKATLAFFPYAKDLLNHSADQRIVRTADGLRLSQNLSSYFLEAPARVEGVLVIDSGAGARAFEIAALPGAVVPVPPTAAAPAPVSPPQRGLAAVLLLALLGGLMLNLMPCVFPVLSLKAIAVLEAHDGRARAQAAAYTAGVVLSFVAVAALLLALRAGGRAFGWGFQLQSPVFVAALAYLFFLMGLALSGVAELGTRFMGVGQSLTQSRGLAGSFFTGVLAVLVASPCTAPFMGPALGYALTQPPVVALAVFAMLGLGLALPFLLIGWFPRLGGVLPRPGRWMESFKQLMAFPLYLTAVALLWILTREAGADAAALAAVGLVLLWLGLWLGRFASIATRLLRLAAFAAAIALLAHPAMRAPAAPGAATAAATPSSEPYSDDRLAQLRAEHRTVFVNFTADWCLTCKVNERAALSSDAVRQAFARHHVAELIGDWTRPDPAITAALARFGRSGVPLYLVYRDGGEAQVLPQILTPENLIGALSAPVE